MASTAKIKIVSDKPLRVEYPAATVGANIVPAMRTPDESFPVKVSVVKTEKTDDGGMEIVLENDLPVVEKVILERYQPDGKTTMCGLKSAYHATWSYSIAHAIVAFFQGANVKGRVYAVTFTHNYNRKELQLPKLFDSGFVLLIEFESRRSLPPTMGLENSGWLVPISSLRDYCLQLNNMTVLADSMTEQIPVTAKSASTEPELVEFEL